MLGEDIRAAAGGLAVALGVGLLIGIERERRKGQGVDRRPAGIRTFALTAATGGLAQVLPVPGLVLAGAVMVAALAALSHWKSRSHDPGLTTELALFTTYLIGVQSVLSPALGAACGAGLAVLLAARDRLHRFATELLSEQELHDGLLLAAFGLIVLPLIPAQPLDALGGIEPRPLATLVLLIMAMQAGGHVALRWLGARGGLLLAGFASGFVSSTATIASLGSQARAHPAQAGLLSGGAALSTAATWVEALVICATLAPATASRVAPMALAGALGAALVGLSALREPTTRARSHRPQHPRSALHPREALTIALLLGGAAVAVGNAQQHFGNAGLSVSVALAALLDSHAPMASLASLQSSGRIDTQVLLRGALLAVAMNSGTRCVVAFVAGGPAFARRVVSALLVGLALAGAVAYWLAPWP